MKILKPLVFIAAIVMMIHLKNPTFFKDHYRSLHQKIAPATEVSLPMAPALSRNISDPVLELQNWAERHRHAFPLPNPPGGTPTFRLAGGLGSQWPVKKPWEQTPDPFATRSLLEKLSTPRLPLTSPEELTTEGK